MSNVGKSLTRVLGVSTIAGAFLGYSLFAFAGSSSPEAEAVKDEVAEVSAASELEVNKAVVARLLEVKGTPAYRAVAKEVFAPEHKVLRNEFENLIYNADDPEIKKVSKPDFQAITERTNTIERLFADNNKVAAMIRVTGKHTDNLYGIPATGKSFEIITTALFTVEDGKIVDSWYLAEEAGLLVQLDVKLPVRSDGKINLPPIYDDVITFDEALAEHMANPEDTPEWRNKKLLLSYKSAVKPDDYPELEPGQRPYSNLQRGGIDVIKARAAELDIRGGHGSSMSNRLDKIGTVVTEGNQGVIFFRLTALNSGELYGIPAGGHELHDWEAGFAEFDEDGNWTNAWWIADELGFLLTIGNQEALDFLVD